MSHECLDIEKLGDAANWPPDSPNRRTVDACPTCRALLKSYLAFLEAEPAAASHPADANKKLAAFLEERIAAPPSARPREIHVPGPRSWWPKATWWRLAPAAAVLALAIGVWAPWQQAGPPIERGEIDATALQLYSADVDDGTISLSWAPHPEATVYRVVLYRQDLSELVSLEAVPQPHAAFRTDALRDTADDQIFWRVFALLEGDEIAHSEPGIITLR